MKQATRIESHMLDDQFANKLSFNYHTISDYRPTHGHDSCELELVIDGSGHQWLNNVCLPLRRGCLYMLSPGDIHRLKADTPITILSINYLSEIIQQISPVVIHNAYATILSDEQFELFYHLAGMAYQEEQENLPYCNQRMISVAVLMLTHLLRTGKVYALSSSSTHMDKALDFIYKNYAVPTLRLQDAAAHCGLSPCYFSTLFSQTVGHSFSSYLLAYRLQRACILLCADPHTAVSDIAFEVGFSSLSHFFRSFQEEFGCTPKQYRKNNLPVDHAQEKNLEFLQSSGN